MVILAYSFRLESADQVPDARTAARTILAQSHISRLTPSQQENGGTRSYTTNQILRRAAMAITRIDTVIIGGGQAGLSVSYYLTRQRREHVVLEQADVPGNAWRNHRWDSFTLNTPNWQS